MIDRDHEEALSAAREALPDIEAEAADRELVVYALAAMTALVVAMLTMVLS